MNRITADGIRQFILSRLQDQLEAKGLTPSSVPDDFDLLTEGVIDSMRLVELVVLLEEQFGVHLDFDGLDPESLTIVGPLSKYIEETIGTVEQARRELMLRGFNQSGLQLQR